MAHRLNDAPLVVAAVVAGAALNWLWYDALPSAGAVEILLLCVAAVLSAAAGVIRVLGPKR